ncbi:MAG: sigma-70 family RNA polymerase sigma factor [Planctomycetes bacterium]|nr:sigma-70 family RNA polymerase sigma factor [Planctomycetota bacterium]
MFQPSLEKLFDRYRRRGDAAALGIVFDRTSAELHKLALHLVRDPAEAEDVLQSTYLAAIESASSYDASRPLVPWLVGILANQAALARRRARREVEPDRLDPRGEPDPRDMADLAEFSSKLGEALAKLPEPYAEVLRMHLADGKKSIDIAKELGREPGTVRMQVHRGLDLLRRALPAGFATGAVVAGFGGTARAALRERVLAEALARGPAGTAAGAATGGAGVALGVKLLGGAIVLAVVGVSAFVATLGGPEPDRESGFEAAQSSGELRDATPTDAELRAESTGVRTALASAPDVADAPDGVGAPGAASAPRESTPPAGRGPWLAGNVRLPAPLAADAAIIAVRAIGRARALRDAKLEVHADASGEFRVDLAPIFDAATKESPLEELVVSAEHPRTTRVEVRVRVAGAEARSTYSVELALDEAAILIGRVLAPAHAGSADSRAAAAPIEVGLLTFADGRPQLPLIDRASVGGDGSFLLRAAAARECLFVAFSSAAAPYSRVLRLSPGLPVDVGTVTLDAGSRLDGRVARAGEPVERALVGIAARREFDVVLPVLGARLGWRDGEFHRSGAMVETDADGRFVANGLAAGRYTLEVLRGEGLRGAQKLSAPLDTDAPGTVALELSSARLEIAVLDSAGRPARGAATFAIEGAPAQATASGAKFGDGGALALDLAPFATVRVTLDCPGERVETFEFDAPGPGETRFERVQLLRETLAARLELGFDAAAAALTPGDELEVDLVSLDQERPSRLVRRAVVAADGTTLEALPAGLWRVRVFVGNAYRHFAELYAPCELDVELAPHATTVRALDVRRGGRVRCELFDEHGGRLAANASAVDALGRDLELRFVARGSERIGSALGRISDLGANDVYPNLAPGEYVFSFNAAGRERAERRVRVEAGQVHELSLVLSNAE